MRTFTNFAICQEYVTLAALGDRFGENSGLIDWDAFRPLLVDLYATTGVKAFVSGGVNVPTC